MTFWNNLKDLLFGHIEPKKPTQAELNKEEETRLRFIKEIKASKSKVNTAETTSVGQKASSENVKIEKKKFTKKKVKNANIFVEDSMAEELAKKGIDIDAGIKEALLKKEKKAKLTVEGNAKLLYTDEEWERNFKNKNVSTGRGVSSLWPVSDEVLKAKNKPNKDKK